MSRQSPRSNVLPVTILVIGVVAVSYRPVARWSAEKALHLHDSHSHADTAARADLQTLESLIPLGKAAVPELVAWLNSNHIPKRRLGAAGLERLGNDAAEARPSLLRAVSDPDSGVRMSALAALFHIDPGGDDFNRYVIPVLEPEPEPGERFLLELRELPEGGPLLYSAIRQLLAHRDPRLQVQALRILDGCDEPPDDIQQLVRNVTASTDEANCQRARRLLERYGL